jgi:hypothetical protein
MHLATNESRRQGLGHERLSFFFSSETTRRPADLPQNVNNRLCGSKPHERKVAIPLIGDERGTREQRAYSSTQDLRKESRTVQGMLFAFVLARA